MKREPVATIGAIITGIMSVISMLIIFGLLTWSDEQVGAVKMMLAAVLPLVLSGAGIVLAARPKVTSMADPHTADGQPGQIVPREFDVGEG